MLLGVDETKEKSRMSIFYQRIFDISLIHFDVHLIISFHRNNGRPLMIAESVTNSWQFPFFPSQKAACSILFHY